MFYRQNHCEFPGGRKRVVKFHLEDNLHSCLPESVLKMVTRSRHFGVLTGQEGLAVPTAF